MNNKLVVNNLAVQYVNWNLKKKLLLPLYSEKKCEKKEKTIRATDLKSFVNYAHHYSQ